MPLLLTVRNFILHPLIYTFLEFNLAQDIEEKKVEPKPTVSFEERIRLYRGLLKVLRFVLWSNLRGPFVNALFGTEEINSLIRVENLKVVTLRK